MHLTRLIFVFIFCGLITAPLVLGSWTGDSVALAEKRMRAEFPNIKLVTNDLRKFLRKFDRYFNDRFGLRQTLVNLHSRIKYFGLGVSPSEDVLLGKNGWLFWSMKRDGDIIAYHRGIKTLSSSDLSKMTAELQARTDWMRSHGVLYSFLVAPNKHSIYPNFLPDTVPRLNTETRMDRFINYARQHTTVTVVDPRKSIFEAKRHLPTYHRTDTHWNAYGAYAAYLQLIEVLGQRFPELTPLLLSTLDFKKVAGAWPYVHPSLSFHPQMRMQDQSPPHGDMAGMIGLPNSLEDESIVPSNKISRCGKVVPTPYRPKGWENVQDGPHPSLGHKGLLTTKCDSRTLNVLVMHDSFGPLLIPYISETFERVTYVWSNYFGFAKEFVEHEKIDVVIQVYVERHLTPEMSF